MVETAVQIEGFIQDRRRQLGANLEELEHKIDAATDWRRHFARRPLAWTGAALAAGVILGIASHGRARRAPRVSAPGQRSKAARALTTAFDGVADEMADVWHDVKGALMAVAAAKLTAFVGDVVPGFREELGRTGRGRPAPAAADDGRRS